MIAGRFLTLDIPQLYQNEILISIELSEIYIGKYVKAFI
jgi:hypothetical protein